MEKKIIGTFIEETFLYGRVFTLIQDIKTKPCTEEEKRIYGVNLRLDLDAEYQETTISEYNCEDGGVFYETRISWEPEATKYFQDLNNAKEFLIKTAEELLIKKAQKTKLLQNNGKHFNLFINSK